MGNRYTTPHQLGESHHLTFLPDLSGLMDVKETGNPGGQLVLAGDPRQLGPVLRSPLAQKHGLGYSLLERLLTYNSLYKKGPNGYDPQFITKLLRNYRYRCPHLCCLSGERGALFGSPLTATCLVTEQARCFLDQWFICIPEVTRPEYVWMGLSF